MSDPAPTFLESADVPEEVRQAIYDYLPPQTLQALRGVSPELQASVDGYLQHLITSGDLVDANGRPVNEASVPPSTPDALMRWAAGFYGTATFPVLQAPQLPLVDILAKYDGAFVDFGVVQGHQPQVMGMYESLINAGGWTGLRIRLELEAYIRAKLVAGGVVYDDDYQPVDPDVGEDDVIQGILDGSVRFIKTT